MFMSVPDRSDRCNSGKLRQRNYTEIVPNSPKEAAFTSQNVFSLLKSKNYWNMSLGLHMRLSLNFDQNLFALYLAINLCALE